ncbi:HAP1 Heme-responsive zinc finger transcription factor HAP1 [Candida maltosa Xu316]
MASPVVLKKETTDKVTKPKRQRNRVPVSCLSCKKRKVKCDKGKPACGGCIRNGVGHLCQYIDPPWLDAASPSPQQQQSLQSQQPSLSSPVKIEQTNEYKLLKTKNEKVINNQRKEIEDLKRQLSVLQQLSPRGGGDSQTGEHMDETFLANGINILGKLSPYANYSSGKMEILGEYNVLYIENSKKGTSINSLDIYSWVNIIKLDPQLTTLWFKITNLQKMYHMYKINKLKNNNEPSKVKKPNVSKINEIDFTHAFSPNATSLQKSNSHKCPVIECDFNLMVEDAMQSTTPSPHKSLKERSEPQSEEPETPNPQQCPMFKNDINNKSKCLQNKVMNLWESILNLSRGSSLKYKHEIFESKVLLSFYKQDIFNIISKGLDGDVLPNLPKGLHEDIYYQLKIGGVFISMIGFIAESVLSYFRSAVKNGITDESTQAFNTLFPQEYTYLGLGPKSTNIVYIMEDLLLSYDDSSNSVSFIVLYLTVLNKIIYDYKNPTSLTLDPKTSFSKLFINLLERIFASNSVLEIWKDPELIEFQFHHKKRSRPLKIHFCNIWTELIRISNLVTFNFVPIMKQSPRLDRVLSKLYSKIAMVDSMQYHLKYLTSVGENELIVSLHVQYLISSIYSSLRFGILNVGVPKLTVSNLDSLIKQCSTWLQDAALERVYEIKKLEIVYMLSYLRLFMIYILMLQGEELSSQGLLDQLVYPNLLSRLNQFVDLLCNANHQSFYIYSAMGEVFARFIQLVVAILIRVKNKSHFLKMYQQSYEDQVDKISDKISSTLDFLQSSVGSEKLTKLSKLWKFYITFINNSSTSKSVNYAKLHAGVPEFSQPKSCPVLHDSTNSSVSPMSSIESKQDFTRCPISQITTPMNENGDTKPSDQDSRSFIIPPINPTATSNLKRRKCPFDHTTMMKRSSLYNSAIESNMREYKSFSPSPLGSSVPITTPMLKPQDDDDEDQLKSLPVSTPPPPPSSTIIPSSSNMPIQQEIGSANSSTSSLFVLDDLEVFNQFSDFDLDFLQNENLMDHIGNNAGNVNGVKINNNGISNNIEDYFQ